MGSRKIAAGAHVLLAAVHVYWATGATWPAPDERSLSRAVLSGEASFAPQVVLPLAALHLLLALAVLRSNRSAVARAVVAGLAAGLAARAALALVWVFTDTGTAFHWLNLFLYTPACVALLAIDVRLLQAKWLKRLVIPLPVVGVVLVSLLAYSYQPTAQPSPEPSKDSRYVETPVARFHYLQRGTGAPVVLLSPGASPASVWQPELEALSKTHAVYVVDLPGQGETRLHGMGFTFALDAMTDALGEFLDQLDLHQVVLGGNTWRSTYGTPWRGCLPSTARCSCCAISNGWTSGPRRRCSKYRQERRNPGCIEPGQASGRRGDHDRQLADRRAGHRPSVARAGGRHPGRHGDRARLRHFPRASLGLDVGDGRNFTAFQTDMKTIEELERDEDRVRMLVRSRYGMRAQLEGTVRFGWCWLQSRFLLIGMAATEEPGGGTRVALTGGVRIPARAALIPIGVRRESEKSLDRLAAML